MRKVRNKFTTLRAPGYAFVFALFGLGFSLCLLPSFVSHTPKLLPKNDSLTLITLRLQLVAEHLHSPTAIAFPGNGEVWITEQTGQIRVIKNGKLQDRPLLDLQAKLIKLSSGYEERGLLGIALHPKFKSNHKFYVFNSVPARGKSDHTDEVVEYTWSSSTHTVDPNSARIILSMDKPEGNHNGGCIQFGPDGYLYLSFGDGGGQGDKHGSFGNGQNLDTWLAKILRIDINTRSGYLVPKDNPFAGRKDVKPEIWAYGFRNPYRFSFDKATGQLFAGDVGQDLWEEVDIVKPGANYGWRLMEGTHCYNPATGCNMKGITMPITEYNHKEGVSVIGGYVYNGVELSALKGNYLFADWTGPVFYLKKAGTAWQRGSVILQNAPRYLKITGFGEDPAGELYLLSNLDTGPENAKGSVYKIVKN